MCYKTLVLSGGGTKGILHLGAIYYLEENNLANFDTYIGTSVGSLIAGLLAVGYTAIDLFQFILHFDMKILKNFNLSNLLTGNGLDDGRVIMFVFKKLIEKKIGNSEITFKQLYDEHKKTLIICATCLNDGIPHYFNYKNNPNMPICLAVRMSMAIPYIFTSVSYNDLLFTDGGLVDNYPIEQTDNINTTIGIYLNGTKKYTKINNLEEFTLSIFSCLLITSGKNASKYKENTINIPTNDIGVINFNMSKMERIVLFKIGHEHSKNYTNKFKLLIDKEHDEHEEINKYINKQIENDISSDENNKTNKIENDISSDENNKTNKIENDILDKASDENNKTNKIENDILDKVSDENEKTNKIENDILDKVSNKNEKIEKDEDSKALITKYENLFIDIEDDISDDEN